MCISLLTAHFTASLEVSTSDYVAQTTNSGTLGSFLNRTPTSLVLSHTTYTCAFKPGYLMSHNWLHTPDCKVLNKKMKIQVVGPEMLAKRHCDACVGSVLVCGTIMYPS